MGIRKYGFTRGLTCLIFVFILCGCASTKGIADKSGELSSEDRRKFDYFYLEAERLKAIGENDAAFDLMSRAADLDTTSAAARFFLAPNKYRPTVSYNRYFGDKSVATSPPRPP